MLQYNNKMSLVNNAIKYMGEEIVERYLAVMHSKYSTPFASIGSGNGYIESKNNYIKWILIDPNCNIETVFLHPDYKTVQELIEKRPELIGNTVLFLNWCLPGDSTYDYDAIILLQPVAVLVIHERCRDSSGGAGGIKFHEWYSNNDDDCLISETCTADIENDNYDLADDDFFSFNPYISWFHNKKMSIDKSDIKLKHIIHKKKEVWLFVK